MRKYVYGIDVGGTTIKMGLFDFDDMNIIDSYEIPTPTSENGIFILKKINDSILECNKRNKIDSKDLIGIGIDVPCPIKNGYVESCANLHLDDIDLIAEMNKLVDSHVKVAIANDATIAAYGENASLEKPYRNAVLITLGTGVGGGVILDGDIVEGATGFGGEIGHIRVYDEEDKVCGCGSKGCLEQICGTKGILDFAIEQLKSKKSILNKNQLTVKSIFDAAKENDEVALLTVHRVAKHIGIAASIISMIVEPEVYIIGGGVSKAGSFLIDLIERYYRENARFSTGKIPFKLAHTGNDAGMIGSAMLVKSYITK